MKFVGSRSTESGDLATLEIAGGLAGLALTYTDGALTSITYGDGTVKTLTYAAGALAQVDHVIGTRTIRKTFTYTDGALTSIATTEF